MIADIIIVAIIVLFAVIGVARGFARTLANLVGIVVTAVVSYYISDFLSQFVYDTFIKETVITNLQQTIQQNGLDYAVSNSFEAVPQWIMGIVSTIAGLFGATAEDFQNSISITENLSATAAQTIERTIEPVITTIFSSLLMFVLFIILLIIVKKLLKIVVKAFDIPVIKQINQLLGGLFGIAEGCVVVFVAVNIFFAIIQTADSPMLQNEMLSGTLFNFFCLLD